jgi:hypothetical protein
MAKRPEGIPAKELSDDDLERELRHLFQTREDTFFGGSDDALQEHTERMHELEQEMMRRRPPGVDPNRTREGARERAGQPT